MLTTTISSREFNHNVSAAKRASDRGPVFITDCGEPACVLLSIDQYRRLHYRHRTIGELLAMPEVADIEFEPGREGIGEPRIPDFS